MSEDIERNVVRLVAADRIGIPVRSMGNKLYRQRPKLGSIIGLSAGESYDGKRVYARVEQEDTVEAARKMADAIDMFSGNFPRHGKILRGYIEETRAASETHLYFGVNPGSRLSANDYIGVMQDMGFTETGARRLYPELMEISRKMAKKRDEKERSVLIG